MRILKGKSVLLLGLCLISCDQEIEKTPLQVTPGRVSIYSDGSAQLKATPSDGVCYSILDDFYASVNSSGLVEGKRIGSTTVVASSKNGEVQIPVTVISKYSLYPELESYVGVSLNEITKKFGSDYSLVNGGIIYEDYNVYTKALLFMQKNGVYNSAAALVKIAYTSSLVKYLNERYKLVYIQNDQYYFFNHDEKVAIVMEVYNSSYLVVMYIPNTDA